jgi:hypothetical protein
MDLTAIGPFSTYWLGLLWAAIKAYQNGNSNDKTFLVWFMSLFAYVLVAGQIRQFSQAPVLAVYDHVVAY